MKRIPTKPAVPCADYATYGSAELGSHYQGQTAATESRYGRAVR